ncbi:ATP-binding protein [Emcibacter sp. SYSU 3D8]|uniref:ATP-binding protein n=1 Tax=Emcibacter sp. SYSU 3D8 TaxID=3133969 RepID=UPI0031FEAA8D
MRRPSSLTLRLILGAGLWTLFALIIVGVVLSFLFRQTVERSFDARLNVLLESLIVSAEYDRKQGVYLSGPLPDPRFEQPYSGWYWQITPRSGAVMISRSLWDRELAQDLSTPAPQPRQYYAIGPDDQQIRVIERDIIFPDADASVRFAVAAVTTENKQQVARFVGAIVVALGLMGAGLVIAVIIQVRYGLRPLRSLRRELERVRSGTVDQLEGRYPAEISPVVGELNQLIAHNAEVLARARTHVGNLAHALKTPLSVLVNESDADSSPLGVSIRRQLEVMRRLVDHYLVRARTAAAGQVIGTRTPVAPAMHSLKSTLEKIYAGRELSILVDGGERLSFRGERQDFDEMLGNLMDNACKWARTVVHVTCERQDGQLVFLVEDDGPGIGDEQREAVFSRGQRLDEAIPGSGLGLSIVRDISGLYGGGIALDRSELGGLKAVLTLPAAADSGPA